MSKKNRNSKAKKFVPKGIRLGWASLEDTRATKAAVSLSSLVGVRIQRKEIGEDGNSGSILAWKPTFLVP